MKSRNPSVVYPPTHSNRRLMSLARTAIFSAALALGGCSTPRTASVDKLLPLQTSSSFDPLFYVGSDQRFHYFNRLNLKYWQKYRVARSEISLDFEFPQNSEKSLVMWPGTLEKSLVPAVPADTALEQAREK